LIRGSGNVYRNFGRSDAGATPSRTLLTARIIRVLARLAAGDVLMASRCAKSHAANNVSHSTISKLSAFHLSIQNPPSA